MIEIMRRLLIALIFALCFSAISTISIYAASPKITSKNADFFAWLNKSTWDSPSVYIIPKNSIVSNSREKYVRVYNDLVKMGGYYDAKKIAQLYWVSYMQTWTMCRIIQTEPDSSIVLVEYQIPYSDSIAKGYINFNVLISGSKYNQRFVK